MATLPNAETPTSAATTVSVAANAASPMASETSVTGGVSEQVDDVLEYGYSTTIEGTGARLTIVGDFVAAHGWALAITDADAVGARFEIGIKYPPAVRSVYSCIRM